MNVLQIIQAVAARVSIPKPPQALGSPDHQVQQLLGLLEDVGNDIAREWHELEIFNRASTFVSVSGHDQGLLTTLLGQDAPTGFHFLINDTFWDNTLRTRVMGALTPQQIAATRALVGRGSYTQFRIVQGKLIFEPGTQGAHNFGVSWKSKNWLTTYPNGPAQAAVTGHAVVSDSDVPLIDEFIMQMGLRAFWKREKGLAYADDFASYERMLTNAAGRSQAKEALYLSGECAVQPGILVPSGSWPV